MLELAPRPTDRVQEVTVEPSETALPLPKWASTPPSVEQAPIQSERDTRLAALAAAADPSCVRVFRAAPARTGEELCTGFNAAFWFLIAVLVGILGFTIVGGTLVVCAVSVWRVQ